MSSESYISYPAGVNATGNEKLLAFQDGDHVLTPLQLMAPLATFPGATPAAGATLAIPLTVTNTMALPPYVASTTGANIAIPTASNRAIITAPAGATFNLVLASDGKMIEGTEQVIFFVNSAMVWFYQSNNTVVRSAVSIAAGSHVHAIYHGGTFSVYT